MRRKIRHAQLLARNRINAHRIAQSGDFETQLAILLALVIPTLVLGLYFGPLVDLANASVVMFGLP